MKLTILGSGTSVPHPKRSSSGFWLETENSTLLLDCSASAVHRMAQEKLDWTNLDAIWISHFHLDHFGGLCPFLFGTKYAPETQNRKKPLKIFGAKGLIKLFEAFDRANEYNLLKQPFPIDFQEVESLETFEITDDLKAIALDTPHTPESLAIRLTDKNDKTIVYSSDSGFTKTLGTLAKDADLFVLECSFFKNKPVETHLELAEAMYLIRYAKPKRAILTHLYPEWDAVDFQKETAKFTPLCEVIESQDGVYLEI
jgi:ribonuclease BN (tRNA processing enzyme)